MIGKPIEFNKPLFMIFIDFTKAFDSIKLDKLWSILNKKICMVCMVDPDNQLNLI